MEYVIGPVLALLVSMKFTTWKAKQQEAKCNACCEQVDVKIKEQNELMSAQTLKILLPVAKSVTKINEQLGL